MSRLLNDFFFIRDTSVENNIIRTSLEINASHQVFDGHFPGMPVVPGVCMTQMIKEILEEHTEQRLLMNEANHLKFLSVLHPNEHIDLKTEISFTATNPIQATASLFNSSVMFFKLKASFIPA